jgi:osmotically-inducible protein OsmY
MPPDSNAQTQPLSNTEVRQSIQQKLHSEPELANARVQVRTNNKSVMLTGKVGTEHQHALVLRIAQSFASSRKVIDKIKLQQRS